MCVPCRGTPFQICRSSMQPTIRAGRSHLPCGTIERWRNRLRDEVKRVSRMGRTFRVQPPVRIISQAISKRWRTQQPRHEIVYATRSNRPPVSLTKPGAYRL